MGEYDNDSGWHQQELEERHRLEQQMLESDTGFFEFLRTVATRRNSDGFSKS